VALQELAERRLVAGVMAGIGQEGAGHRGDAVLPLRQRLKQRQGLLDQIQNQQQQAGVTVRKRADQLRFELVRNSLRTLLIALAYLAGFLVLCGRSA
jgi:hypothetical protein